MCKEEGYEYNDATSSCLDIDECLKSPCDNESMVCQNSQGSYNCDCKAHYTSDGNGKVCKGKCSIYISFNQVCDGNN